MALYRMDRLKKILVFCLFVLVVFCACNNVPDIEKQFDNVFEIHCESEDRLESIGTAFLIDNGKIITNAHIVSYKAYGEIIYYETIYIVNYSQQNKIYLEIKIVNYEKDYAVLKVSGNDNPIQGLKGLSVSSAGNLKIGEGIYTIGNLNNYGLAYSAGHLSSKIKNIEYNGNLNAFYQTDIEISKGSSGGPVFNNKGQVIGIMTFKVRDMNMEYVDGMSFFIPIENIEL